MREFCIAVIQGSDYTLGVFMFGPDCIILRYMINHVVPFEFCLN